VKRLFALGLLSLAACNGPSVTPLAVQIVTPSGADPFAPDAGVTHVHIEVREGTTAPTSVDEDVAVTGWHHDVPITDITVLAATRVALTTPGGPLIGAAPDFVPAAATSVVRLPVGPPETCGTVAGATLATSRGRASAVVVPAQGTFALVAGEGDGLEVLDLLALAFSIEAADTLTVRDARFVVLGGGALALSTSSDGAARYVFANDATMRQTPVTVHAGASSGTPLSLQADGAVIVGGGPSADVTFVGVEGASCPLSIPADRPATSPGGARSLRRPHPRRGRGSHDGPHRRDRRARPRDRSDCRH